MADYLVDTNLLLRRIDLPSPLRPVARQALRTLRQRGDSLYLFPQNVAEFWNVATRPTTARGGFGLTVAQTDARVRVLERVFTVLPDTPAVYAEWRQLVVSSGVIGVAVHDARIVAAMRVHGLTHILTFDMADFARYPGIVVVDPAHV